ncbi:multidrug transporter EmrE-like cation transporter [Lysobacter sp. OAE881]
MAPANHENRHVLVIRLRCVMNSWLSLLVAIVAEVVATTALKSSEGFTRLVPSVVVVIGYGVTFYFLSLTLKSVPVGIAYAVWSGLGVVLITAVAWALYGQKLDAWAILGMALIVSGVLVMNLLSKSSAH